MKPNNISDIEKLFDENFWDGVYYIVRGDAHSTTSKLRTKATSEEIKIFYRSQIEQLLGRIDTEKLRDGIVINNPNQSPKDGYNQKSSEIANQIKELIK